jgi:hypothetical protein
VIAERLDRRTGQPSDFRDLVRYILNPAKLDAATVRIANCDAETPDGAVALVKAAQAQKLANARFKGDPTYHLAVSFPPGERPTPSRLADVEEALCAAIGLGGHQRISGGHVDTEHFHFHVAINKIHPESLRFVEPYYDKKKLNAACERLEVKHGLTRTNHRPAPGKIPGRAGKMEACSGEASLLGWIRENALTAIGAALDDGKGWRGLHEALAAHGLEIKPRGAGLVVVQEGGGIAVKASSVDRRLSLQALTRRLGAYEPPAPGQTAASGTAKTETRSYQRGPGQPGAAARKLYAQFQRQRAEALEARAAAFARRREARARGERPEPAATMAARPPLTWMAFLRAAASGGDGEALSVLRWRERRQKKAAQALITAKTPEEARHVVFARLKPRARRDGALVYRLEDGGVVADEARQVRVEENSAHAAFLALTLAMERFAGQALVVEGSDAFKRDVTAMAAAKRLDLRFADPALEAERQKLAAEKRIGRPAPHNRTHGKGR